jgi:transformation/transcription domain-associated protein
MASASLAAVSASSTLADTSNNKAQTPTINKQYFIDLFKYITNNLLPKSVLKEWATYTYSDATDYFHFRKLFTGQFAIYGLLEYVCHLTRLNPDQFYISQNTGVCQTIRFKFDLNEQGQQVTAFNADRSVPFRLTPNIAEFITSAGINGVYNSIQIAQARCLVQPQYHFSWILRAILKDEILTCMSRKVRTEPSACWFEKYLIMVRLIFK